MSGRTVPRARRAPAVLRAVAAALLLTALVGGGAPVAAQAAEGTGVEPLRRAHAHNDYEHARPLHDALDHGFTSVEVDVWLVDGELLVGHDREDLVPGRTVESLYLDPLAARVRANGGEVYDGHDVAVQLLVDLKNTGPATYRALHERLRQRAGLFTTYAAGRVLERAVTVVVSGERDARPVLAAQRVRHAFYDGRLADLGSGAPASFMPLVSDSWARHFTWQGVGPMPRHEREKLHRIVDAAHADGQRVRFWATPDADTPAREAVWRELLAADVDHLNTDDLAGLAAFLREHDAGEARGTGRAA